MGKRPYMFQVPEGLFGQPIDTDIQEFATDAELARSGKQLGVRLPAELLAVLRVRNGGQIRLSSFKLPSPAAKQYGLKVYSLSRLAGVHPTHSDAITQQTAVARAEWELPDGLIPLCGDGHTWCCLDYRACGPEGEPSVAHIDLEQSHEFTLAPNFAAFISKLFRDPESLTPALISLDSEAPVENMLAAALQALGCRPFTFPIHVANPKFPRPPTWHWPKYRGILSNSPVWIEYQQNKLYESSIPKTPKRPEKHPMLTVAVAPADEETCLRELLAGLGPAAVLIHGVQ
ncbi:MAG: SMI1/KNR4 family protein [Phycisphaerales bacterium]